MREVTVSAPCCGEDMDVRFYPGSPAVMYQRNGDPGWPEEPPGIEYSATCAACGADISSFDDDIMESASNAFADREAADIDDDADRRREEQIDREMMEGNNE